MIRSMRWKHITKEPIKKQASISGTYFLYSTRKKMKNVQRMVQKGNQFDINDQMTLTWIRWEIVELFCMLVIMIQTVFKKKRTLLLTTNNGQRCPSSERAYNNTKANWVNRNSKQTSNKHMCKSMFLYLLCLCNCTLDYLPWAYTTVYPYCWGVNNNRQLASVMMGFT